MPHISDNLLKQKIEAGTEKVKLGSRYYHYKDPNVHYVVLFIGLLEWKDEPAVIYKSLKTNFVWIRQLDGDDGWLTPTDRPGTDKHRFIPV